MKKLMSILLILAMLSCFACSDKTEPGGQDAAAVTDAPTAQPTAESTAAPTEAPTTEPTAEPTEAPAPLTCYGYTKNTNDGANAYGTKHELTDELQIWKFGSPVIHNSEAPETVEVSFDGLSYRGTYRFSGYYGCSSFLGDRYRSDNASFIINSVTGELVEMAFVIPGFYDTENPKPELADPRTETEAIARAFAEKLLDPSDYDFELEVQPPYGIDEREYTYYLYYFFRPVLGEMSNDRFYVWVSSKGTVCGWMLYDVGAFDPLPEDISRFEGVDLDAMIEAKVNECLHRDDLEYADFEIDERMFCVSPVDGGTVMYVDLKVPAEVLGEDYNRYIYIIIK